ncbi:MAG TPA: 50S ribosomal protein L17 [Candidatus Paceibacterota bacterium]|nr:50S ribosomal protein L17 [Candidatus Paceibacterota bacterium]
MRHNNHNRKFGRPADQRRALLRSLAEGLILHGRITTTEAKAKELRPFVEKLITKAKTDSVVSRRLVVSELGTQDRAEALFKVAPRFSDRPGGYTRIVKLPRRTGDASPMAIIELV